ncbi:hypothetical protein J3458_001787 [Metarhizium acridum]|uniref:Uncharacterized protein n=1 Tax=Metarhizium acridum (strain CQMa 102) TaxID=655827 RepID=E9DUJ9_METAQ|nr:uncharacterized protein MAC_01297 [Metarhizium acridum CQMa 102]EFY92661.1 hypothetical protein MAC_01297 [Metarhizium acridum CQMa 102]KAG8425043.1 hypothetical protein J3458_001787 [Metarhizium acridum]
METSPSLSNTPRPHLAKTSSVSPQDTTTEPQMPVSIKQEEEDRLPAIESVDPYDQGYESSVDAPIAAAADMRLELEEEKRSYPGASTWADEEERLFEILFQRADIPLLPAHWHVDFRGIPVVDSIFSAGDGVPSIIYSRSTKKEFQATMALIRLIDLTSSVRTTVQSGLRKKATRLIKRCLDKYIAWAAEDGGYSHLKIVPNITTAVMDAELGEKDITGTMKKRMRALAMAQREFLRVDRDDSFWDVSEVEGGVNGADLSTLLVEKYLKRVEELGVSAKAPSRNGSRQSTPRPRGTSPDDTTPTRTRSSPSPSPIPNGLTPEEKQSTRSQINYRHKPPVVYGLFILRTSVFLLTADSAKGDSAYVSFHVDMHFMDRHQSVWNALTAAIAVCLARDQLSERIDEFEELPASTEESESEV